MSGMSFRPTVQWNEAANKERLLADSFKSWQVGRAVHLCNAAKIDRMASVRALTIHVSNLHSDVIKQGLMCKHHQEKCASLNICVQALCDVYYECYRWTTMRGCNCRYASMTQKALDIADNYIKHWMQCKKGTVATVFYFRRILGKDMAVYIAKKVWESRNTLYK